MAGRISELTVGAALDDADLVEYLDVSDTAMAATGTNKRRTLSVFKAFFQSGVSVAVPMYAPYGVAGTLAVAVGSDRWYMTRAGLLVNVAAWVQTVPTGAAIRVDVNKNGSTVFTTQANRPNIAAGTRTDLSSVPDAAQQAFAAGDYFTVDVDAVGSTIAGADLVVLLEWKETVTS